MENFIINMLKDKENHCMTYAEYIEAALYTPNKGYYMNDKQKIGKSGDFYTVSNFSDVFGRSLARWFLHLMNAGNLNPSIYEIGGGNGRLAEAVMSHIKRTNPEIYKVLTYHIIETSPYHRELQKEKLKGHSNTLFYTGLEEIGSSGGIFFSNELFDAFPVHVIEKQQGQIFEVMVSYREGELAEVLMPLDNEDITAYLMCQDVKLTEGQRYEVPLQMISYLKEIANKLDRGVLITIDYGYTHEEWQQPIHKHGSLRGYHQHQLINNVLQYPGEMDITTHIHFDALIDYGAAFGLKNKGLIEQNHLLLKTGILNELQDHFDPNPFSETSKRNRAIRSLIIPGGISSYFRTLIQVKKTAVDIFPVEWNVPFTI
ncbi:SAM-dependent methyltransferase [Peribacillus saganii]|uniref:SAM-dependent methyltransferase n=1 Tax=Peribacillus saganii TaxID=2303992 RepID=A0A372LK25_9BACI|nr:SAM-dependent methyltransferase [Peribacillus saganii]RFU66785.1 SAM-dependent methyltransferase [Peribacillus saganii]